MAKFTFKSIQESVTGNHNKRPFFILKTVGICVGIVLFCLLNILILFNSELLIPDERSRRLLWFSLRPEFWANWYSFVLWTLAAGFVISAMFRLPIIQRRLDLLTQVSLPRPVLFVRCIEYLNYYPLERRFLSFLRVVKRLFLYCILPQNIPALVLCLFVLISWRIILVNTVWGNVLVKSAYQYFFIFIPAIPQRIVREFYTNPLTNLLITGEVSWKLILTIVLIFLVIAGFFRYVQRIRYSSRRNEQAALLIRYFIIVIILIGAFCFAPYLLFLVQTMFYIACLPFAYLDNRCDVIRLNLFFIYYEYTITSFYLLLNEGILMPKLIVSVIFYVTLILGTYFYFRRIFYSPECWKRLYRSCRVLVFPFLIFCFIFYDIINIILSQLSSGMFQIYQQIARLPSNTWDCIYFAPCYFLYYSVVTWRLLVASIILFVFLLGLYLNPFRRIFNTISFSPILFYVIFWTIFLCTCFSVLIWKIILFVALLAIIYYVIQSGVRLPKIRIRLSQYLKKISYHLFIYFLIPFDICVIIWDIFISFGYYWELYLYFLYQPMVLFFLTGRVSWLLLVPVVIILGFLFMFVRIFLLKRLFKIGMGIPTSQFIFFMSSIAIIILLDVICFIYILDSDTKIRWLDIRFCPYWAFLIPLSFVTLSISGLRIMYFNISNKTIILPLFAVMTLYTSDTLISAENSITLLEPAKFVSSRDVRLTLNKESHHSGGGYVAAPKIVDCFASMEYKYTGGRFKEQSIRFRLRMPREIKSNKKYPLIVWFHGQGESGNDNTRQLAHLQNAMEFFAGSQQRDFFMLATQCPKDNNRWERSISKKEDKGDSPLTITGEILEAIIQEFPVDVNRISIIGASSGGSAAWEFVRQHPRRFVALTPGSGRPPQDAEPELFLGTIIWAFNNRRDNGTPFDKTEQMITAIKAVGGDAYLTLYDVSGHDAWTPMLRDEKIIGWLILQSLAEPGPPLGVICRPRSKTQQFLMFGLPISIIIICIIRQFLYRNRYER
ncbi:MAG: hypothetical protein LBJ00_11445 [Planctomycetaceae bacterium]|jgi:predicted esterase|nr:hypothetical protein [Planctomycetaceae bacterium]